MGRRVTRWTPDRLDVLRGLVAEGLTDAEIAQRMGMSKNAIDQQVYRLGLRLWGQKRRMDARNCRNPFYAARKAAGITRQEAAERSGISEQLIGQHERGAAKPSRLLFWRTLAQIYGCTIGDLLKDEVLDTAQR